MNEAREVSELMNSMLGMGACRLADGALHLGHYNGCFRPDKLRTVRELLFVIQDSTSIGSYTSEPLRSTVARIAAQLYSIPSVIKITPCLQTAIFGHYAPLFDVARRLVSVRLLETTHPKKQQLTTKDILYLHDYLFPLDQAVQILATWTRNVLMNDDNQRSVRLARKLYDRLTFRLPALSLLRPQLILGNPPRLFGADGKKMSRGNRNAVFLLDSKDRLSRFVKTCLRYLRHPPEAGDPRFVTRQEPAIATLGAFLGLARTDAEAALFPEAADDLEERLMHTVWSMMASVQDRYHEMILDQDLILQRLTADQEQVRAKISATLEPMRTGL